MLDIHVLVFFSFFWWGLGFFWCMCMHVFSFGTPVALTYMIVTSLKTYLCHFCPTLASFHGENPSVLNLCTSEVRNLFSWTNSWICCFARRSFYCLLICFLSWLRIHCLSLFLSLGNLKAVWINRNATSPITWNVCSTHRALHMEQRFRLLDLWTSLLPRKETKAWVNFLFLASCIFVFCFDLRWTISNHNFFALNLLPSFQESTHIVPLENFIHAFPEPL